MKSWRDVYKVHPAADLFPTLPEDELRKLGEDIKANGLKDKIILWSGRDEDLIVLDGRNRLDAMELMKVSILENQGARNSPDGKSDDWGFLSSITTHYDGDPYSYVISKNIRRRHLSKEQQADLIVKVIKAKEADLAKMAKSVERNSKGQVKGSTKDPIKQAAVEEGKKHGISKRMIERAPPRTKVQHRNRHERKRRFKRRRSNRHMSGGKKPTLR